MGTRKRVPFALCFLALFSMVTFARAPIPPLDPMWVSGEERARIVQQLIDQAEQIGILEHQLDDARDDLRTCRSVNAV